MDSAFRKHWPEYCMEAALLGAFMISACAFAVILYHPDSTVGNTIESDLLRRCLMGVAMGATAVALIYSPWGKQSGAHMNPALTLTFWRLGKIAPTDAACYIVFQSLGGALGVLTVRMVANDALAHPAIHYVATTPGAWGEIAALAGETVISFTMMFAVLASNAVAPVAPYTGIIAGTLVMLFITFEAPISGMSINPARTFASAVVSGDWRGFWIYVAGPLVGMSAAAELFPRVRTWSGESCAKLHHRNHKRCIFCEYQHSRRKRTAGHTAH